MAIDIGSFGSRPEEARSLPLAEQAPGPVKLAVVVPALNEEETIGSIVAAVPREIPGVRQVEVIVVDDGSSDETRLRALAAGADRIARNRRNRGLATAFSRGINAALETGADIVVHLDGDGQHDPSFIPELIEPILAERADLVLGVRPLAQARELTPVRRHGNRIGSWMLGRALDVRVSDMTSGYRAFSREALLHLNVVSDYTYTLETLIQASRKRLAITEVIVPALPRLSGTSRMTHSLSRYIGQTGGQAMRTLLHQNPLAVFGRAAGLLFFLAAGFSGWFLLSYQFGGMHLPALLAALLTFIASVGLFVCGLLADGINRNTRLLEDTLYRLRALELRAGGAGGGHAFRGETEIVSLDAVRRER